MGAPYTEQLHRIERTFSRAASQSFHDIGDLLDAVAARQALFVGAGGTLAIAQLAADLHEQRVGRLARAVTPLEFVSRFPTPLTGAVLFSASAKHPDARTAMKVLDRGPYEPSAVITHRPKNAHAVLGGESSVRILEVPNDVHDDGFLATNSVIAMATALIRAYFPYDTLPARIGHVPPRPPKDRRDWIALTAPGLLGPALDFETRLAELGVGTVQIVDYRNFAHGRHFGAHNRRNDVAILALVTPEVAGLAERTLSLLPGEIPTVELRSAAAWPVGALELLAQSISLASAVAEDAGVEPSKPGVPKFGRRLYHLSMNGLVPLEGDGPIEKKLAALGVADNNSAMRERLRGNLEHWLAERANEQLGALALDYDGTVCSTDARFEPLPPPNVRHELLRLLEGGLQVGFASGRGGSLYEDLREWIPQEFWSRVHLALYNGGLELRLAEALPERGEGPQVLAKAAHRLRSSLLGDHLSLDLGPHQLTVRLAGPIREGALVTLVRESLERPPGLGLKITASGHSVDVVSAESTKVRMLRTLENRTPGAVLAIGDQGQLGGNDFELLAATRASLSVDRCSSDPERCWNLGEGSRGPQLLASYLQKVKDGPEPRFVWRE